MDPSRRLLTQGHGMGIPLVAHKRLTVSTPPPAFRLRNSVLLGELDRIYNRTRPHPGYSPTEDFLNSRPLLWFDDETKSIRAQTQALLRRVHTPLPRASRPLLLSGAIPYHELPLPERITSDPYIIKMLEPYHTVSQDVVNMSHYYEPSRTTIGRGHLACVSFAGGRGYPRRKHLYSDENRDIRDEIKFRSYYDRNRMAVKEREAANILPTGFAARLLRLTPEEEPHSHQIRPYRHTKSTPLFSKEKADEKKAKELENLEARIQKRRKEKEETSSEGKLDDNKKLEEERLAEQARITKARQLEEEKQAEEMRQMEEARRLEEAKKAEEARKLEEKKRKEEEEARKIEEEARIREEERRKEEEKLAEEARMLEKLKKEEEARLAEEARLKEEARLAEEARLEEEARLAEEARLEEEARLAEEARLEEEARLAEEAKLEEEARLAEEAKLAKEAEEAEIENQSQEENISTEIEPMGEVQITEEARTAEDENGVEEKDEIHQDDPEPFIEEPQSPDVEHALAEVIEGADATSEELEEE